MDQLNLPDHPAIVSALPGRLRLRHADWRDPSRHQAVAERLAGMGTVSGNPAIGSLLLRYDPARTGEVAAILAEILPPAPEPRAPARRAPGRRPIGKRDLNRAAKIGAMLSLALSLAALPGNRRLHAQAGAVFVALTLVHMAVHWRQTFR